jgi:competence protein ComEA
MARHAWRMEVRVSAPSRHRLYAAAAAVAILLALVVRYLGGGGGGAASRVVAPVRPAAKATRPTLLVVDVAGAVRRPGLYRLPRGSRIDDAIAAAGGPAASAQLDAVNLAAPLADGEQIVVPVRAAGGAAAVPSSPGSAAGPLDLNSATAEQLEALPGIGPVTAQKILDYRQAHGPFHSLAELEAVPGIGPGRLAQLKGLVIP